MLFCRHPFLEQGTLTGLDSTNVNVLAHYSILLVPPSPFQQLFTPPFSLGSESFGTLLGVAYGVVAELVPVVAAARLFLELGELGHHWLPLRGAEPRPSCLLAQNNQ